MPATRTQIYLTRAQREHLDDLARRRGKSLADLVRQAVDRYLAAEVPDPEDALEATFGTLPDLDVPSRHEWDDG